MIDATSGRGPDAPPGREQVDNGIHAVVNIPSVYVPSFVKASKRGDARAYKNAHDLKRVGSQREFVETAIVQLLGVSAKELYYCAAELNGTGVRFYGDICLVLSEIDPETTILDRNSYDLDRLPIRRRIEQSQDPCAARIQEAKTISGRWARDLQYMLAYKVMTANPPGERRLTTGTISDAILHDEDYVEVLKIGSFGTHDLVEARTSAADAAAEAQIADRIGAGNPPALEAQVWRRRRSLAERALTSERVRTVVTTTAGRVKQ